MTDHTTKGTEMPRKYKNTSLNITRVALICVFSWNFFLSTSNAEVVDQILAVVNEEIITQRDMDEYLAPLYFQYQTEYKGEELSHKIAELQKNGLNQIIEEKLLLSEAKKRKVEVDPKEIQVRLDQVKTRFSSEQEFYETVAKQGLTVEVLKDRYRDQLMINHLVDEEVRYKVTVSPTEIAQYYSSHSDEFQVPEKVRLKNILIRTEDEAHEEEAFVIAQEIQGFLESGVSFESLAKKYSQGAYADKGGDMGLVARGELAPELEAVAFGLESGKVSPMVKNSLGYHFFKAEQKVPSSVKPLVEVQDEIESKLYRNKTQARFKEFIAQLRAKAYVSVRVGLGS